MPFDSAEFFHSPPPRPSWTARLRQVIRSFRAPPAPPQLDPAVLRVLEEARGLIELRQDWVQGRYETIGGERCAVGAVRIAAELLDYKAAEARAHDLLARVAAARGFTSIEAMNDRSPHGHVLAAFDEAIMLARNGVL
jgi:hypothetical protein